MPLLIRVRGPSGAGKTTLIERLLPRLAAHGLNVGVVKHAHDGVTLDQRGKDSWRFWSAGAPAVLVAAPGEVLVRQRRAWSRLSELLGLLPRDLDCVLVEGFGHVVPALDGAVSVDVEAAEPLDVVEAAIIQRLNRQTPRHTEATHERH